MDKVAIISDIHGNVTALNAVLADIRSRGIETIYNLGDLIGKGPNGSESIEICREACTAITLGNWDAAMLEPTDHPVVQWPKDQLTADEISYLGTLPFNIDFQMSGRHIRLYHASEASVWERVYPASPLERHIQMFTNSAATGYDRPEPDVVVFGDIHVALHLPVFAQPKLLLNAGSVGNPLDQPVPSYLILSGDLDNHHQTPFSVEFARIPYDIEAEVKRAYASTMPAKEEYAIELRTAVYRGRQNNA